MCGGKGRHFDLYEVPLSPSLTCKTNAHKRTYTLTQTHRHTDTHIHTHTYTHSQDRNVIPISLSLSHVNLSPAPSMSYSVGKRCSTQMNTRPMLPMSSLSFSSLYLISYLYPSLYFFFFTIHLSHPQPLNGYIHTKIEAEKLVLKANRSSLLTSSIRPSHIFGPRDPMIGDVIRVVQSGGINFRFGSGLNDFVYVENAAHAHVCCLKKLEEKRERKKKKEEKQRGEIGSEEGENGEERKVDGEAFFISDTHTPFWDFLSPFLLPHSLSPPSRSLPFSLIYSIASLTDFLAVLLYKSLRLSLPITLTRFIVMAVAHDFTFTSQKAKERLSYTPLYTHKEAVEKTVRGREERERKRESEGGKGHKSFLEAQVLPKKECIPFWKEKGTFHPVIILHILYAFLSISCGVTVFFNPSNWANLASSVGMTFRTPIEAGPYLPHEILCQTAGLIYGVLGVYSLYASFFFPSSYFWISIFPRFVSASLILSRIALFHSHPAFPFLYISLAEFLVAGVTMYFVPPPPHHTLRNDWVTISQLSHAILSGIFAFLMTIAPRLVLPVVFPGYSDAQVDERTVVWANMMGDLEFFMTWLYTASAFGRSVV